LNTPPPPTARLETLIADQIWHAQVPIRFGPLAIRTRMTVVRLGDGSLWVHSPIAPAPALVGELQSLGCMRFVVAPNKAHHRFLPGFLAAFPEAEGFVPDGLVTRRPELARFTRLTAGVAEQWQPELVPRFIAGLPHLDEYAWLHVPTGTLLLTDLLACVGPDTPRVVQWLARTVGIRDRLGMSATLRRLVADREAFAASVDRLLELDFDRVIVAHDQVVERSGRTQVRDAFAWLARPDANRDTGGRH
jgi:hypothetical protein